MFNRIAKTGSQSFIELLVQLEKRNGVMTRIELSQIEQLMDPPSWVAEYVVKVEREERDGKKKTT